MNSTTRKTTSSPRGAAAARPRTPRGISIVPILGDVLVFSRLLRDKGAHWALKLFVLAVLAYVISPVDFLPEIALPFVGWLDDLGAIVALRLVLDRVLGKYRYPLFADPPVEFSTDFPTDGGGARRGRAPSLA